MIVKFMSCCVLFVNKAFEKEHLLSLGEIFTRGTEAAHAASRDFITRHKETRVPVNLFAA